MTDHPETKIDPIPANDGKCFAYRGARIYSNKLDTSALPHMPGHPFDQKLAGGWKSMKKLVGQWLDNGKLSAPFGRMNPTKQ